MSTLLGFLFPSLRGKTNETDRNTHNATTIPRQREHYKKVDSDVACAIKNLEAAIRERKNQ